MFGKIIKIINGNIVTIENKSSEALTEIINHYIIFEEESRKIVGEILEVDESYINVLLIGEIKNNGFTGGLIKKPSKYVIPRIIDNEELELIIGTNKQSLIIGKSAIYEDQSIRVSLDDFFGSHSAVIGNTGSGKSCGVARMLQNLLLKSDKIPNNAHIVLFDAYGEYKNTFNELNNFPNINFKKYTTKVETYDEEMLKIPLNFLEVDDLAILLGANNRDQLPVLEKTLKLVYIFTSTSPRAKEYKNDIIAECLLDILTSGKSANVMRDQIIAVLSHYNTETLNLESVIKQPGYDRTLKQCLLIDEQGKMNAIRLVTEFLQSFKKVSLDSVVVDNNFTYNLSDLYYALEFALISEGIINSITSYDANNVLKTRLQSLINSDYKSIFEINSYIEKEEYIKSLFKKGENSSPLININLSHVDDRFAKILTKLMSKLLFTYTTNLIPRGSFGVNIILEEAHRYVQNDNDINIIGYNIFDRITKEGRKYGTLLTFITQRPSELSETALSQCSNFIVFRIFHPKDFEIVKSISTNVSIESLEKLKTLSPGTSLVFGTGFKVPILAYFELPYPMPESTSLNVSKIWY